MIQSLKLQLFISDNERSSEEKVNRNQISAFFLVGTFFSLSGFSQASDEAAKNTVDLLKDRKQIEELAATDQNAKRANYVVNRTVGTGAEKDQLLQITSDIMGVLIKKHKGDISAMQADLMNAMRDPKKFIESLTPEQRAQVRTLASEVEKKNKPNGAQKP